MQKNSRYLIRDSNTLSHSHPKKKNILTFSETDLHPIPTISTIKWDHEHKIRAKAANKSIKLNEAWHGDGRRTIYFWGTYDLSRVDVSSFHQMPILSLSTAMVLIYPKSVH